jgi:polyhydroxybutyrate depolymerase
MPTASNRVRPLRDRRAWRDPAAPLPVGTERRRLDGREYLVTAPASDRPGPHGLILNLHGLTSNMVQQLEYSRLARLAPLRGYVVLTPQGSGRVPHWTVPPLGMDDVGFIRAAIDSVTTTTAVDPARRFVTGISNGAAMAMALIAAWPGYFAAVAPVAGVNAIPARPVAGTAVIAFHGTEDRLIPYDGGALFGGFRGSGGPMRHTLARRRTPRFDLPGVDAVMEAFVGVNGVTAPPTESRLGVDVVHRVDARAPRLELFTVLGGGHTWPGSADTVRLLGATTHTVDATAVMLDRFDALGQD